jgi:Zn-dependent alcohol dehydrogenase
MKTKAAVLYQPRTPLKIEEVELGPVKDEDVLVRIVASGVCHSDLHVYHGQGGWPLPVVLGHEAAGVVEEVGAAVRNVRPGDHIIINLAPYCGRCDDCTTGRIYLCDHKRGPPGHLYDGGTRLAKGGRRIYHFANTSAYANHAIIHESGAIRIGKHIPLEKACLVGCALAAGVGAAMNSAKVEPGQSVAVFGCGGVGLNVIQGARLAGASSIIAVDLLESKLAKARDFGATETVDASMEDPVKRIQELTRNRGADYAFEVIGKVETIQQAYQAIRTGGKCVVVGVVSDTSELSIVPRTLVQDRTIIGTRFGSTRAPRDFPLYLDLYMQGRLKIDELITRYAKLEDINDAIRDLERGEAIRTVMLME